MTNVVGGIIVFVLWLHILGIATTNFLVFLSSPFLVAIIVFGDTLKAILRQLFSYLWCILLMLVTAVKLRKFRCGNLFLAPLLIKSNFSLDSLEVWTTWISGCCRGNEYLDNSLSLIWQPEDILSKQCTGHHTDYEFLQESRYGRRNWLLYSRCHTGSETSTHERKNTTVSRSVFIPWFDQIWFVNYWTMCMLKINIKRYVGNFPMLLV